MLPPVTTVEAAKNSSAEPDTAADDLLIDQDWYEATFGGNGTPSFSDFAYAHLIPQIRRLPEDDLRNTDEDKILAIHLDNDHVVLFTHETIEVQPGVEVLAVPAFLYDNAKAQGGPVATMIAYVLSAHSGSEADVFAAIECGWADVSDALFLPFQDFPAAFTRLFAIGMVGYCTLTARSDVSPSYKLKLHQVVVDAILPAVDAKPYVMFYDTMPPGYRMPADMMMNDLEQLPAIEQVKGRALLEQRESDEAGHVHWLREKLQAAPVAGTLLAMAVLDERSYTEEVLFTFSMEDGCFALSVPEPREEPIEYEDYAEGNYEPLAVR